MARRPIHAWFWQLLTAVAFSALLLGPALAADAIFPTASRIGLVPPSGFEASDAFMGFEDRQNSAYIRLIALPQQAFAEIEKTLTNEALTKQGLTIEKREQLPLRAGNGILVVARQNTGSGQIRKWLLIAPVDKITAMVSFEVPVKTPPPHRDAAIRASLQSVTARTDVPPREQLAVVPFKVGDTANFRLVRVVPGMAAQFTDGPKDTFDATDQPHLIISVGSGAPATADRDQFARNVMRDLPPFKDVRIASSEPMRIGGQPGYEVRATGKDAQDTDIEIIQWLRFGTGAHLRILGFAPKDKWAETYSRFREVRDGLESR